MNNLNSSAEQLIPYMPRTLKELLECFFKKLSYSKLTIYEVSDLMELSPVTVYEWRKALNPQFWKRFYSGPRHHSRYKMIQFCRFVDTCECLGKLSILRCLNQDQRAIYIEEMRTDVWIRIWDDLPNFLNLPDGRY